MSGSIPEDSPHSLLTLPPPIRQKSGIQTIRVRVWDATDDSFQPRGKQVADPHGLWYSPVTGIWQTVWLEAVDARAHIESYNTRWDGKGHLKITTETSGLEEGDVVKVQVIEGGVGYNPENPGEKITSEGTGTSVSLNIENPKLWSPDSPNLYGLRISILRNGEEIDCIDGYTALRTVMKIKDPAPDNRTNGYNRIGLNGSRLFNFGPLDQGWWPDGLYTAPTDEALRFDIEKVKEWGWNTIRKHIKVEPARWYWWCDALGVMVWQDMPIIGDHGHGNGHDTRSEEIKQANRNVWSRDSFIGGTDTQVPQQWKDNFYKEWKEIMVSLRNFQCITVWVPFNEAWGQFDTPEVVGFTRRIDDSRLINEASGGNYSLCGDIVDVHHYACPAMNFFEGTKINVLGEYGGIGYKADGHIWKEKGHGYGKFLPDYDAVLQLYSDFAERLKVFVSTGCAGAIYTQITDVEGELNGIMTYDREVIKVNEDAFRKINTSVIESQK